MTYMTYIKICLAAIERYTLEKPLRELYKDAANKKRLRAHPRPDMPTLLKYLVARRLVVRNDATLIRERYKSLSEVLHGRLA